METFTVGLVLIDGQDVTEQVRLASSQDAQECEAALRISALAEAMENEESIGVVSGYSCSR